MCGRQEFWIYKSLNEKRICFQDRKGEICRAESFTGCDNLSRRWKSFSPQSRPLDTDLVGRSRVSAYKPKFGFQAGPLELHNA